MSDAGLPPPEREPAGLRELVARALRLQCLLDDTVAAIEERAPGAGVAALIAAAAGEIDDDRIPAGAVEAVVAAITGPQEDDERVRVCPFEP